MKVMSKIGLVLAVAVVLASLPAGAACGITNNRAFVGYTYHPGFVGGKTAVLGNYWVIGAPANNNGTFAAPNWLAECLGNCTAPDGSVYMAGDWAADSGIAGCPADFPAAPKMAYLIQGPIAGGGTGYGGGCVNPSPLNGNYTFGESGASTVPLQSIPKVNVTGSTRNGGGVSVTANIGAPSLPGGVLDEASCGLGAQSYKIYSQTLARGAGAPVDRNRGNAPWTAQPGLNPSSLTLPCTGNQDIYLAYSIVYNDGIEGQLLGPNSTVVQCGSTSADQPNDFKIIKKPIRKPTSAQ